MKIAPKKSVDERIFVRSKRTNHISRQKRENLSKSSQGVFSLVTANGVSKNGTAAMLGSQTNPVGVQLYSYVNTFICSNKSASLLGT